MGRVLSDAQVAQYHRDGFLHPIELMPPASAKNYRQKLEIAEAQHPQMLSGAGRNNPHLIFPFLDEIVHGDRMLDVVEDIIGHDILVWGTVLFIKEANDPGFVSWHQDATHVGLEPHIGVTVWLALSPSTLQSGCMRMIPGTHRGEIRPHHDTFSENNILTRGQTITGLNECDAVDLLLEAGEMSLHHPRVIHSSAPNQSTDRRVGVVIQSYLPPIVRQTKGEGYAQRARGNDNYCHFLTAGRPTKELQAESVALRDRVNTLWAKQLYQGAEMTRDL